MNAMSLRTMTKNVGGVSVVINESDVDNEILVRSSRKHSRSMRRADEAAQWEMIHGLDDYYAMCDAEPEPVVMKNNIDNGDAN